MKLSVRVERMADGLEREGTRLADFLERKSAVEHVRHVFIGNRMVLLDAVQALRKLTGAEKAIMLAGLDRLVAELRLDYEVVAALAGVEIGGRDTVLAGLETDALLAYGKAQKLKQLIPQIAELRRLGEKDQ